MKIFTLLLFIINILAFSCSSLNSPRNNRTNYLSDEITFVSGMLLCFQNYNSSNNESGFILSKCLINLTRNDVEGFYQFFKNPDYYNLIFMGLNQFDKDGRLEKIFKVLQGSALTEEKVLINHIYNSLKHSDSNGTYLLDYMYSIIDDVQTGNIINHKNTLNTISFLFQEFDIISIYEYLKENNTSILPELVGLFLAQTENFEEIYRAIREDFLKDYINETVILIIDVISTFNDSDKTLTAIGEYFKNYPGVIPGMKKLMTYEKFSNILKELFSYYNENTILDAITETMVQNSESLDLFFELANHSDLIDEGVSIVKNIKDMNQLIKIVPPFLAKASTKIKDFAPSVIRSFMYVAGNLNGKRQFMDIVVEGLKKGLLSFFESQGLHSYNITQECLSLFNNTFFNMDSSWNKIFLLYFKKFIFDSPRKKGDFLAFDNCMDITNAENIQNNITYKVEPAFIVGIVDDPKNKFTFKNTTFYEKYYYISNYCLPYGYRNKTDLRKENAMCNDVDYNELFQFVMAFFTGLNNTNFETIVLDKKNVELTTSDNVIGFFTTIILLIPIIIKIFLVVNKCIINQKNKKIVKINKLIANNKKEKRTNKNESFEGKEHIISNKKELPKYQKLLNEYFDFIKNGSELFNFNLNNTNFNNVNGITYIKGLMGLSIILTIFGLTFTILINIPMKEYGSWHFHKSIKSIFFFFVFIGYRYSPRILFSCSGYTLVYKYLCYIEQEQSLYFLKFVFLQSYKYILLYLVIILFRYTVYEIVYFFHQLKRPAWVLFEHYLKNEKNFLLRAFTLLFNFEGADKGYDKTRQNLIYNFYIPINEIFFFIVGTILISFSYKYRLRLDFIIICTISFFFISKVIIYGAYFFKHDQMYTTTDYYMFDFGIHFLNPIYNLTYFLMGMYFGLINYSIQKGITDLYATNAYKKYIPLKESNPDRENSDSDLGSNLLLSINTITSDSSLNITQEKNKNVKENDINKNSNEKIEKLMTNGEIIREKNEGVKEYKEQVKKMPFLISPIKFYRFNKDKKDKLWYNILIFIALIILGLLCFTKTIFLHALSSLDEDSSSEEYMSQLSLEMTISNEGLNIIYLFDVEIVVFLSQWIIFILFFKEATIIRSFCNSIYWSFFVKSYYPFTLVSVPVILIIFYESESVIKIHIYNFILYSFINLIFVFIFVVIFYSIYDLPLKKIFKYFLKGSEIMEEEDEDSDDEEEENEKEEEALEIDDEEEEMKSLKS